jgi:hypothetical protein
MNSIVDGMEALLADAHKGKGWHWVCSEPMWTTWPMEKFGVSITSAILARSKYDAVFTSHIDI